MKKGGGILFTIDETQAATPEDLIAIATAVQHVITDQDLSDLPDSQKKGVAFAFAGLPSLVDELVNNKVLTFLRRSLQRHLGDVPLPDVKNALIESFASSGKELGEEAAARCARLTSGYPYMIQLVGYYVWQSAQRDKRDVVTETDIERGFADALQAFGDAVCAPAFDALPSAAKKFACAMAEDGPEPSKVADIGEIPPPAPSALSQPCLQTPLRPQSLETPGPVLLLWKPSSYLLDGIAPRRGFHARSEQDHVLQNLLRHSHDG